mmetsp:Transcript_64139/g.191465  ORF Transcript_64139/g.191465 Transcript_64139/m.191465 type:complete len:123 (+) Transcript_64139:493-861(+)
MLLMEGLSARGAGTMVALPDMAELPNMEALLQQVGAGLSERLWEAATPDTASKLFDEPPHDGPKPRARRLDLNDPLPLPSSLATSQVAALPPPPPPPPLPPPLAPRPQSFPSSGEALDWLIG